MDKPDDKDSSTVETDSERLDREYLESQELVSEHLREVVRRCIDKPILNMLQRGSFIEDMEKLQQKDK